jgi:hypothetical protein
VSVGKVDEEVNKARLTKAILTGAAILMLEGDNKGLILPVQGLAKRKIAEPQSEKLIRGPKEGFIEDLSTNIALIRRRVQDPSLKIRMYEIGRRSRTKIALLYIKDIIKEELVDEIDKKILGIDIDMISDTSMLEEFIQNNVYSPFPQVLATERSDKVSANLVEGRAAIFADGSPFAIILPITLATLYQSPEDYYERAIYGTAVRFLRLGSLFIATTLPALYVSMISFHHQLLPARLVLTLAMGRILVPYPAFVEAVVMEVTIEVLREASTRLPGPLGQTIGVVGGLVLGQAAVSAKLVSPAMVIIVSLTAMATFTAPNYSVSYPIRFIRFPLMLLGSMFGAFGLFLGWATIIIHLCSLESFGVPYLAPLAPLRLSDWKDFLLRLPIWTFKKRPIIPENTDQDRMP